jgi:hypothetical protein
MPDTFLLPNTLFPMRTSPRSRLFLVRFIILKAYSFVPALSFFRSATTQGLDDMENFNLVFNNRVLAPTINSNPAISFESFQYESLLRDVYQGVGKGYFDR